jgi:hypothetical protein
MSGKWRAEIKDGVLITGDAPGGNYRAEVIRQGLKLPPGVHHTDIYHDGWCAIFSGRECDCDPDIVVRPHPVEEDR